ncbi:OsmC family protein [bacterium]|nr:OsmC family protein [bacterium]
MSIQYPMTFKAQSKAAPGMDTSWRVKSSENEMVCAIPPEFEGAGGGLSPEDLFAQALTNCFVATFKVYAQHSRLSFTEVRVQSDLIVDLDENKKPVMKKLVLNAMIVGAENPQKAQMLATRAMKQGFILNSVKTEIEFNISVDDVVSVSAEK